MKVRNLIPPPAVILIFLICAAGIWLAWQNSNQRFTYLPAVSIMSEISPDETQQQEPSTPVQSDHQTALMDIRDRPLFQSGRRPWVAPIAAPVEPEPLVDEILPAPVVSRVPEIQVPPERPEYIMTGIMTSGKITRVLLEAKNNEQAIWLELGETLDGWTIDKIERDHIVLRQEDHEFIVPITQ